VKAEISQSVPGGGGDVSWGSPHGGGHLPPPPHPPPPSSHHHHHFPPPDIMAFVSAARDCF
jgi:hypothetical protein